MMKFSIKEHLNYVQAGITVFVILLLTLYCKLVGYPLIIPLMLLFLGLHLFLVKKGNLKSYLQLALLLGLLVLSANYVLRFTNISPLYLPVAAVPLLTMLLFSDLQLTFIMAFAGSATVALLIKKLPYSLGVHITQL